MLSTLSFFCCLGRCYRRARCLKNDAGFQRKCKAKCDHFGALPVLLHPTATTIPTFKSEASNTDAKELAPVGPTCSRRVSSANGSSRFPITAFSCPPFAIAKGSLDVNADDATVGTKLGSERSLIARTCSTSHVENAFFGTAPRWERASATRRAPDSFTISRRHHTCSPVGRTTAGPPLSDQPTE